MATNNNETAALAPTAYFIKFKVKPGKNADFEKAIGEVMDGVREKETGNVYCDLLRFPEDHQTYAIVERFKDVEASAIHAEGEHIETFKAAILKNDLLDGPPEVQDLAFIRSK